MAAPGGGHPWPPIGRNIAWLRKRAGLTQEGLAERSGLSPDLIRRLEQGNRASARIASLHAIASALDTPLAALFQHHPEPQGELTGEQAQAALPPARKSAGGVAGGDAEDVAGGMDAVDLAGKAGASNLGPGTLEAVEAVVDRRCRDYSSTPPRVLAPRVRERLRYLGRLLDGRATLAQRRELLAAGGWLAALLAVCQFDLGQRDAAEANRHAAFQLGREIGHRQVMAWALETQAWFAVFEQRFRQAADLAREGQALAPAGTPVAVQLAG